MKQVCATVQISNDYRSRGSWTREEHRGLRQQIKEGAQKKALQKQEKKKARETYNIHQLKQYPETTLANQTNLGKFQNLVLHVIGGGLAVAPIAISAWHMFYAK